jgi:hypothetical protein
MPAMLTIEYLFDEDSRPSTLVAHCMTSSEPHLDSLPTTFYQKVVNLTKPI